MPIIRLQIWITLGICLFAVNSAMAESVEILETNLVTGSILLGLMYFSLLVLLQRSQAKIKLASQRFFDIESQLEEVSLQNTRLEKEINTDRLTRIGNRAHFEITYGIEWDRALRDKMTIAMLMINIDNFRHIKDQFGHAVSDDCLIASALSIRGCLLRASDRVMRYGGEEFAVLLGGTDSDGIRCVSERILAAVQSIEFIQGFRLSISIGGASVVPGQNQCKETFLSTVDRALYRARENGPNRIELVNLSKVSDGEIAAYSPH